MKVVDMDYSFHLDLEWLH